MFVALETSTQNGSVSIKSESGDLLTKSWLSQRSHSSSIHVELQNALSESGATMRDIKGIAVGIGPGSFTGIRVAINCARAIVYGLETKIQTMSSLKNIALQTPSDSKKIVSVIYGFRNLFYCQEFERQNLSVKATSEAKALTDDQISSFDCDTIAGSGLEMLDSGSFSVVYECFPQAELLLRYEEALNEPLPWAEIIPLYIRDSEPEEKLKR